MKNHWSKSIMSKAIIPALMLLTSGCGLIPSYENSMSSGQRLLGNNEFDKAEESFEKALAEAEKSGKDKEKIAAAKAGLAGVYVAQENYDDAENLYSEALGIEEDLGDAKNATTEKIYHGLGTINLERNASAKAEKYFTKAVEIQEALPDADEGETASLLSGLGRVYLTRNQKAKAQANLEQALDILDGMKQKNYKEEQNVLEALANIASDDDDMDKAAEYKKRITDLQLSHAKNVMSILPWVNVKGQSDGQSGSEADSDSE